MDRRAHLLGLAGLLAAAGSSRPAFSSSPLRRVLRVGPGREIKRIADAARLARDGDRIEVDAGDYRGDVAVWPQDDLVLQAVGGRARLLAGGTSAEGKGTWVVRGGRVVAQGFDFLGSAVAAGNGAGIRFEAGWLTIRDCSFIGNEMGLLTGNDGKAVLEVENSEFAHNFRHDRHNHNLYVGAIARFLISGSYLHHARTGHLLKSRAAHSTVLYNRLTDEPGGRASYELEFPNGGIATVLGNIVAQGADTENPALISFGAEGWRWPANELHLAHNTLIDHDAGQPGACLVVWPGAGELHAINNLLVGREPFFAGELAGWQGNVSVEPTEFAAASDEQFRLRPGSRLVGSALQPGYPLLVPQREYAHPRHTRPLAASAHNPGAMQSPARQPSIRG